MLLNIRSDGIDGRYPGGEVVVRCIIVVADGNVNDHVTASSRSADRLAGLKERVESPSRERLVGLVAEIGTIEGAERTRDSILDQFGPLDIDVASLGRW